MSTYQNLPILTFKSEKDLRNWLMENHTTSQGIWLRIYKKHSGVETVAFEEVLDQGLCFGWSESTRSKYDEKSYLQRFSPRRAKGTTSKRNLQRAEHLIKTKQMMPTGLNALGIETE
ncbi:MAG: hypothetical protein JXB38_18245 [Anaerolineales bacterium]|nr:hypothetical protein [Anaerolineales bacterium]